MDIVAAPGVGALSSARPMAADGGDLETVDDEPEPSEPTNAPGLSCTPAPPHLKPLQLLRFAFASGLEGKDPRDKLSVARPAQRIYTHLTLRNRSGEKRCVTIELSVGGQTRTTLVQSIGVSWSWRTWAYNTLRDDDRGKLEAVVRDDQGNELARRELAIVSER